MQSVIMLSAIMVNAVAPVFDGSQNAIESTQPKI